MDTSKVTCVLAECVLKRGKVLCTLLRVNTGSFTWDYSFPKKCCHVSVFLKTFFPGRLWSFHLKSEVHSSCVRAVTLCQSSNFYIAAKYLLLSYTSSSVWQFSLHMSGVNWMLPGNAGSAPQVHTQRPSHRPQLPGSIGNPRQSYGDPVFSEMKWWCLMHYAWCFSLCICGMFSVYLDVINQTVPILVHLVSWEWVSSSCISCSCLFLIWLQCKHCTSYSDSYAEKCGNHTETQKWPRESTLIHSDMWVVNNT